MDSLLFTFGLLSKVSEAYLIGLSVEGVSEIHWFLYSSVFVWYTSPTSQQLAHLSKSRCSYVIMEVVFEEYSCIWHVQFGVPPEKEKDTNTSNSSPVFNNVLSYIFTPTSPHIYIYEFNLQGLHCHTEGTYKTTIHFVNSVGNPVDSNEVFFQLETRTFEEEPKARFWCI